MNVQDSAEDKLRKSINRELEKLEGGAQGDLNQKKNLQKRRGHVNSIHEMPSYRNGNICDIQSNSL